MSKKKNKPFAASLSMSGQAAVIEVSGVIGWDADAMQFNNLVDQAKEAGASSLTVRINSVGGYCYDGLSMGDKLLTCGIPTRGEVLGCAMSMASYLLQCCSTRVAHRHATLMFHQPSACICGTVDEMLQEATYLVGMRDRMFEQMGARCGKSGAELSAEHMTTKYYTAVEALACGFLDAIDGEGVPAETPEETPAPQPVQNCRVFAYDRAARIAMLEDEPEEVPAEEDAEEAPQEPAETPETPEVDNEPTEGENEQEAPTEPQESPAEAPEDEPAPAPEPEEVPEEETITLTRAELEAAVARGAAAAVAALGVSAAALVEAAPTAAAPAYTRAELDAMPAMARLRLLREHPALMQRYMNSGF